MMAFNRWDEFFGFNNGASNYLLHEPRHNPIFTTRKLSINLMKRGESRDEINHKESVNRPQTTPSRADTPFPSLRKTGIAPFYVTFHSTQFMVLFRHPRTCMKNMLPKKIISAA